MINNLFSVFDPLTNFRSINWIRSIIFLIFIPQIYWLYPYKYHQIWKLINNFIFSEIKISLIINNSLNIIIFRSLFIFISINNFISLFPYIFNSSSHLRFSLTLSLTLWLRFIIFGWIENYTHIFIHLTPQGTPKILIPFIVIIESIRNLIRPLTLAIRLSANIIAGHLLITLIRQTATSLNFLLILILISLQSILITLELAVSFIQAYVFSILRTLYSSETNYEN